MKKYMIFQSVVLFFILTSFYVKPMEIESVQDKFCYLTLVPLEILNYIASFLPWESEEELIARMKIEKNEDFPEDYFKYFLMENNILGINHVVGIFSPDKEKIALFELLCGGCGAPRVCGVCDAPKLVIVDLHKEKEEDRIMYSGFCDKRCYRTIGLSSSGSMVALILKERKETQKEVKEFRDFLVINNMVKIAECRFEIPDKFMTSCLMFNKQGTDIIAYGRDYSCEPMRKKHLIFPLKKSEPDEQVIMKNKDEQNVLQDYFKHYRVCKSIQ